MALLPGLFDYLNELAHGPIQLVVDEHATSQLQAFGVLELSEGDPFQDVIFRIASPSQPRLLHLSTSTQ